VGEIVDIPAVFPLGHALIVMASFVLTSDAMRITDEEGTDVLLLTEIDHLPGRFMA